MAKYVDGFVLVIPKDKTEEYKKMASEGRDAWMRHGALAYYECIGDDLTPKEMGGEKHLNLQSSQKQKVMKLYGFRLLFLNQKNTAMKLTRK